MSRKFITFVILGAVILIAAASLAMYLLSFKTITFDVKKNDLTAGVYLADDSERNNKIADVKQGSSLRLQEGKYVAVPQGELYSQAPIPFTVEKSDATVTINPSFSEEHLANILSEEASAIKATLEQAFGSMLDDFDIDTGKLYLEGQWYATTLTHHMPDPADQGDIYRVLLLKKDNHWEVIGKPKLVFTTIDFPNVPLVILQDANRLGE